MTTRLRTDDTATTRSADRQTDRRVKRTIDGHGREGETDDRATIGDRRTDKTDGTATSPVDIQTEARVKVTARLRRVDGREGESDTTTGTDRWTGG